MEGPELDIARLAPDPLPLKAGVNTSLDFENFVVFSPDGREIHFVRGFQLYWRVSTDAATGR